MGSKEKHLKEVLRVGRIERNEARFYQKGEEKWKM